MCVTSHSFGMAGLDCIALSLSLHLLLTQTHSKWSIFRYVHFCSCFVGQLFIAKFIFSNGCCSIFFLALTLSLPHSSACVMCMRVSDARFFGSGLLFELSPINSAWESWFVCLCPCMLALIFSSHSFDLFVFSSMGVSYGGVCFMQLAIMHIQMGVKKCWKLLLSQTHSYSAKHTCFGCRDKGREEKWVPEFEFSYACE